MKRKSFILHLDSLDVVKELTTEQKADLFQAIIDYNLGNEVKLSGLMNAIFIPFKNQFLRDNEKYNDIVNRNKNNGLKGGRPKTQTNQNKPKKTQWDNSKPKKADNDNDSVNDNDNVNDNVNDNKHPLQIEFEKTFDDFVKMRRTIKKPMTEKAKDLTLKKLRELSKGQITVAIEILNQSIENSWQGVFALKKEITPELVNRGGSTKVKAL